MKLDIRLKAIIAAIIINGTIHSLTANPYDMPHSERNGPPIFVPDRPVTAVHSSSVSSLQTA